MGFGAQRSVYQQYRPCQAPAAIAHYPGKSGKHIRHSVDTTPHTHTHIHNSQNLVGSRNYSSSTAATTVYLEFCASYEGALLHGAGGEMHRHRQWGRSTRRLSFTSLDPESFYILANCFLSFLFCLSTRLFLFFQVFVPLCVAHSKMPKG